MGGSKLGYRPALDGLRAVAILGVLVFHLTGKTGGSLGVTMFFVLSGFLITTLLVEEREANGRIDLRGFYRRRFRRLAPALLAAVIGYLALSQVAHRHEQFRDVARGSAFALGSFTNIADAWSIGGGVPPAISHTWSLGLEDQFYLVWPPILILLLVRGGRRAAGIGAAVAAALVFAHSTELLVRDGPSLRIGFAPDTAAYPILLGCLTALLASTAIARRFQVSRRARWFDVAAALIVLCCLRFGLPGHGVNAQLAALAFAALIAAVVLRAVADAPNWLGWLAASPLVVVGRISYSLYLWHVIVLTLAPFPILFENLLLAIVLAVLSYRFIEQPFRRRRSSTLLARPRPATALTDG